MTLKVLTTGSLGATWAGAGGTFWGQGDIL